MRLLKIAVVKRKKCVSLSSNGIILYSFSCRPTLNISLMFFSQVSGSRSGDTPNGRALVDSKYTIRILISCSRHFVSCYLHASVHVVVEFHDKRMTRDYNWEKFS